MLLSAVFALALSGAPQQAATEPNTVAPAIVQPRPRWPGVVPSDLEITQQLDQLLKEKPDMMICVPIKQAGTRLPQGDCRSLQSWYDLEFDRDVQARVAKFAGDNSPVGGMAGPPYELVDLIKARYRLPSVRARAEGRAMARAQAARQSSPATPAVSNP